MLLSHLHEHISFNLASFSTGSCPGPDKTCVSTNVTIDPLNCGWCGVQCNSTSQTCSEGLCVCKESDGEPSSGMLRTLWRCNPIAGMYGCQQGLLPEPFHALTA